MKKLKFFIQSLVKSTTQPSYYVDVIKAPMSSSLKFFSFFLFLLLLIEIIAPLLLAIPAIPQATKELDKLYPSDLEIKIENGQLSTNRSEPYYIVNDQDAILAIDTTGTLQDIPEGKSGVLITKDRVITKDSNGFEERVYKLSQFKDSLVINKDLVTSLIQKAKPIIAIIFLVFLIIILPFIYMGLLITNLIYAALINIFPYTISKLLSLRYNSYSDLIKISLHAFVLPQILQLILVTFLKISFPPFSFTLFYLTFITIILISLKNANET